MYANLSPTGHIDAYGLQSDSCHGRVSHPEPGAWARVLPSCPLTSPGRRLGDSWCSEGANRLHCPPSAECFRSYATSQQRDAAVTRCAALCRRRAENVRDGRVRNNIYNACMRVCSERTWPLNGSGQQCCYDRLGQLVTTGPGAGTPDLGAGAEGENPDGSCNWRVGGVITHIFYDVMPYLYHSGDWYHHHYPPNQPPGSLSNDGDFTAIVPGPR
jgi:hypothetical protein